MADTESVSLRVPLDRTQTGNKEANMGYDIWVGPYRVFSDEKGQPRILRKGIPTNTDYEYELIRLMAGELASLRAERERNQCLTATG